MKCFICGNEILWSEDRHSAFGRVMCSKTCKVTFKIINPLGNKLLKEEYPSFVRKEAPSKEDISETMQDTPFQW